MAQIPNMTRDLGRISRALSAVFPDLDNPRSINVLGEGFRSMVVETPDENVFKIAKNWESSAGLVKEMQILPLIRDRLAIAIPNPLWHAGTSNHFPFGVLGYPKLHGEMMERTVSPAQSSAFAEAVARFLVSLHHVQLQPSVVAMLPGPDMRRFEVHSLRSMVLPVLRELLHPSEYQAVDEWWKLFLADPRMREFDPVLQHGDLWYENMLMDATGSQISGIIDFENLALGDPAQDFATLLHLGREFAEAVLDHYQLAGGILDTGLRHRIQRLWELREFTGMKFAIHFEDQPAFDDALYKLRKGPILDATTRRETAIWQPPLR